MDEEKTIGMLWVVMKNKAVSFLPTQIEHCSDWLGFGFTGVACSSSKSLSGHG